MKIIKLPTTFVFKSSFPTTFFLCDLFVFKKVFKRGGHMKFLIFFCLNSLSFISRKSYESHMKSAYTYDRENQVKKSMIRYKAPVNFAVFLPTPETIVTDIMYNYVFKGIEFSVNWRTLCIHTTHMYIHLFILHTYIHIYERMYVSTVEFFLVK